MDAVEEVKGGSSGRKLDDKMQYDAIVVGAGPAGSTAARALAKSGLLVMMLDKAEFPRDKPCGGAVSVRCAALLGLDISPVIERAVSDIFVTHREWQGKGTELYRSSAAPFAYMTQRSRLDALLAEKAVEAGVTFRQRETLGSVEQRRGGVTARTLPGNVYRGRVLVAADGANGVTARMSGISLPRDYRHSIAIEGNITPRRGFPPKWEKAIGLDLGMVEGGYSWLFPKEDHLNIGLGGYHRVGPKLRTRLNELAEFYGFDAAELWGVRGHWLPQRRENFPLVTGNALLVGDAAGVLDPLTAEGIFGAVQSAQIAAASIVRYLGDEKSGLQHYTQALEQIILPDMEVARCLHGLFYRWPSVFIGIEKVTPVLWRAMVGLFRGNASYGDFCRRLPPVWPMLRLVSHLKRTRSAKTRHSGEVHSARQVNRRQKAPIERQSDQPRVQLPLGSPTGSCQKKSNHKTIHNNGASAPLELPRFRGRLMDWH